MTAPTRKINLVRIAHINYTYQNLERAEAFFRDFGFVEASREGSRVYYRGYGPEPFVLCAEAGAKDAFGGAAFVVESEEDLLYASQTLPGASAPYELSKTPGGGRCVTFEGGFDKFPFHLVCGQVMREKATVFPEREFNFPTEKHREPGTFQRFDKGPAPVHKLGHFGACVTDFQQTYDFFTTRFNFIPSDLVHDETGRNVTVFLRLDRGDELVDHHSFFFFEGPKFHVHHASFETHDSDLQFLGHDWLRERGYENCWGVGRHVMGSQIFDYWFDPSKFIFEHYVDGDQMNSSHPPNHSKASPDSLHIWGPDLPEGFLL
ncbi:Glyoxalase/Bleomycin resistance protein/Dihydroxybiphenyl dioxygenase [Colletotrichum godetiae]|uniref:Glyoxalase/Bleomycin resistance protein/Dihydroxybiphenyl dioxygenase n=1 Tax=Colletotrichum godetiae TaxID=1209918 RepID=A0AAJ0ES22_9PEZI|nr:Glyoxalase/Bleomycin resistance protein/Dihydroxybiphenyl dioxygenase [Colletotrichum godetiae]KAK1674586.1 Glyoxalase/Bleomycin resistance protein/Dihydroxybiphenyl dioxygenase [Colletotrichum godetiae]